MLLAGLRLYAFILGVRLATTPRVGLILNDCPPLVLLDRHSGFSPLLDCCPFLHHLGGLFAWSISGSDAQVHHEFTEVVIDGFPLPHDALEQGLSVLELVLGDVVRLSPGPCARGPRLSVSGPAVYVCFCPAGTPPETENVSPTLCCATSGSTTSSAIACGGTASAPFREARRTRATRLARMDRVLAPAQRVQATATSTPTLMTTMDVGGR